MPVPRIPPPTPGPMTPGQAAQKKFRSRRYLAEDRSRTGKEWCVYDLAEDTRVHEAFTDQAAACRIADSLEQLFHPDLNPGDLRA